MLNQFSRAELLFGKDGMAKLARARVAVFGIGGVGGNAAEALARGGVGTLALFDSDKVCLTNINRQLYATRKTVGSYKVDAAEERIKEINPDAIVQKYKLFYTPETSAEVDLGEFDYIIDAIDTVSDKIELALRAQEKGVPIIACMGAGNKLDPTAFEVADIYETSICPLAKVMRRELKKRGVEKLKVVYSKEPPLTPSTDTDFSREENSPSDSERKSALKRSVPGSNSFVPPVAGLILAGEVIKDLIGLKNGKNI